MVDSKRQEDRRSIEGLLRRMDEALRKLLSELCSLPSFKKKFPSGTSSIVLRMPINGFCVTLGVARTDDLERLTPREKQIAELVGHGLGNQGIAADLGISEQTVAHHLTSIYKALGITSRAQLARWATLAWLPET